MVRAYPIAEGGSKSLSTVQSVAIKWTLNVRMARSAALRRLQFGGTYWNEMFSCFMKSYKFLKFLCLGVLIWVHIREL